MRPTTKRSNAKNDAACQIRNFSLCSTQRLAELRVLLYQRDFDASTTAGQLSAAWAAEFGLKSGLPIAIGEMDVHYGAIGCGIADGVQGKVIGTSTCDCPVVPANSPVADIPGICGIVKGAILPGYYGIEAGQSAVGDIFEWWVEVVCRGDASLHASLTAEAAAQRPGQNGLLALDTNWGDAPAQGIAESARTLLLASLKNLPGHILKRRAGAWSNLTCIETMGTLYQLHLGIFGYGAIARRFVKMCRPLQPVISIFDPYASEIPADIRRVDSLMQLFEQSLAIAVMTPLNAENTGSITAEHLAALPDHAVIIHNARSRTFDEAAHFLRNSPAGACAPARTSLPPMSSRYS